MLISDSWVGEAREKKKKKKKDPETCLTPERGLRRPDWFIELEFLKLMQRWWCCKWPWDQKGLERRGAIAEGHGTYFRQRWSSLLSSCDIDQYIDQCASSDWLVLIPISLLMDLRASKWLSQTKEHSNIEEKKGHTVTQRCSDCSVYMSFRSIVSRILSLLQ